MYSFSKELASYGDVYVTALLVQLTDAHASTEGVSHYLPSMAGF